MTRAFSYRMEALLKLRRWDLDVAKAEEQQSRLAKDKQLAELNQVQSQIAELEAQARSAAEPGTLLNPATQQMTVSLLKARHVELRRKAEDLRAAEAHHATARDKLLRCRQRVATLEKHREAQADEYLQEAFRAELKQMDDLWLQREGQNSKTRGQ